MKKYLMISVFTVYIFLSSIHYTQAEEATSTPTDTTTEAPVVVKCSVSKTSILPGEEVTWTAELISGENSENNYAWILEGDVLRTGWGKPGLITEKFDDSGIKVRYFVVNRHTTSNQIGKFSCGSVEVKKFPLESAELKPDLITSKAYHIWQGQNMNGSLCADIKNIGQGKSSGSVSIKLLQGNYPFPTELTSIPIPGESKTVCVSNLTYRGNATLDVWINEKKTIDESNTDNNKSTYTIFIPERPEESVNLLLLSPQEKTYYKGEKIDISWESADVNDTVKILIISPNASDPNLKEYVIAAEALNTGKYTWTVSHPELGKAYKIAVIVNSSINNGNFPYFSYSSNFIYLREKPLPEKQQEPVKVNDKKVEPVSNAVPLPIAQNIELIKEKVDSVKPNPVVKTIEPIRPAKKEEVVSKEIKNDKKPIEPIRSKDKEIFPPQISTSSVNTHTQPLTSKPESQLKSVIKTIFNFFKKLF